MAKYIYIHTNDFTMKKNNASRRAFIKNSAYTAAGFFIVPRHVIGKGHTAPSDKLNIAAIGAGGKGRSDIANAYNNGACNVVALSDVDWSAAKSSIDKFPNAKLLAVKGSWGWGGNSNVNTSEVNRYYDIFKKYGVKVLDNAIGKTTNPHKNLPIYAKIGEEIDKNIT